MNANLIAAMVANLSNEEAQHVLQELNIDATAPNPQQRLIDAINAEEARFSFVICYKPPHSTKDELLESVLIKKCYTYKDDKVLKGPGGMFPQFGMPFPPQSPFGPPPADEDE